MHIARMRPLAWASGRRQARSRNPTSNGTHSDATDSTMSEDLHGNAPDKSPVVLCLIDTINDLEFPGGEALLEPALQAAKRIRDLKLRCAGAGIPCVYVNDNFGRWRSNFRDVVDHCLHDGVRGEPIARLLQPADADYFVLKPKHSAFFATTFETLLDYLGAQRLILTGFTGNMCVLFTAIDAFNRDLKLSVPPDCVASIDARDNEEALGYMERTLDVDLTPSAEIDLEEMVVSARTASTKP